MNVNLKESEVKRLLLIMLSVLILSSCGNGEEDDEMENDFNGAALISSLSNGWNLGNTLDANSTGDNSNKGLSTEKSWGMPETSQAMIRAVAERGFKSIRLPVSWHNHITEGTNYTIDSAWMARVKTVVDWSLEAGLKVIINIHHDNLSESQMASTYGFCVPASSSSQLKITSLNYIRAVWRQVAEAFREYDERLVFELLNEPRAVGTAYEWNGSGANVGNANKIIMDYEKAALDEIRKSGGKNATRYVMVPPYAASPSMTEGWALPSDSASGKLIVSLHAYTPYEFCMSDMSVTSFGSSQKGSIDWLFSSISSAYTSKGIRVVIGEASASDKGNTTERKKWAEYYFGKAKALGIPVFLWDNMATLDNQRSNDPGERHGYFNRNNLSWYFPEIISVITK